MCRRIVTEDWQRLSFFFLICKHKLSFIQFAEQCKARLFLPLELQMEGRLSIVLIWLLILIFSEVGGCLHRALPVAFFSLKTLAFNNIHILLQTRGSSFPFAADRFHIFSLYGLDSRTLYPLLVFFEQWQTFKWPLGHRLAPFRGARHKIPLAYERGMSGWCASSPAGLYVYARNWI